MAKAGSVSPSSTYYTSRYGISTGLVTCTICHDPHLDMTTAPKILRATTAGDVLCKQCHIPYYQDFPGALLTHPVGTLVVPTADPLKFNASVVNSGWGQVQLVDGYVSCTSCHSTHFADSDSATEDGLGQALNAGDGRLLRTDGPKTTGGTLQQTANKRSAICTACHPYKTHGNDTEPVACLVCHSAHVYNPVGLPNYFVLRNNATTTTFGAVSGLNYTTLGTAQTIWADGSDATTLGYCEKCHGNLATMPGSLRQHTEGENCRTCHAHHATGAVRSFEATGCDGCHSYPPATNVATTGYALDSAKGYNYSSDANFKNEATTPHPTHSGASSIYKYACAFCHNADFATTHDKGTFQDVFNGATFQSAVKPSGSGLAPSYTKTGNGLCSSVACHSNGGKRTGDSTRTYKTTTPAWAGALGSITTCNACHGNDTASMAVAQRDNSQVHNSHLNKGYDCSLCHQSTAVSANALKAGTVQHVNGNRDVAFNTGFNLGGANLLVGTTPYNGTTGVCAVYCHSDGNGNYQTPDWDSTTPATCDFCHDGKVGNASVMATGAHTRHVSDPNGPQMLCSACHGAGADTATHAGHINGVKEVPASTLCNGCHGATVGGTGNDAPPVWFTPSSVRCETCHIGTLAVINSKTAPNKSAAVTTGHNRPTASGAYPSSGNIAANKICDTCHDANAAGHFDGISGDDQRLETGLNCDLCHGSGGSAVKKNIVTHQSRACGICHDPHGGSNLYMVKSSSADYSGTVVFTALSGANSYDEDDNADGGVSEVNADDLCATCHSSVNGIAHNNRQNTDSKAPTGHKLGLDCFTCHRAHTDAAPFGMGSGTACNDCHGFPPASAAHAEHSKTSSNNKDIEDRTDCAKCHTGANLYTYDLNADALAGRNHSDTAGRRTLLIASVGYNTTNFSCTTACHKSSASDGYWSDSNGLNCDACHYYAVSPSSAANSGDLNPLTGSHGKHFGSGGVTACIDCHALPNGGLPLAGPLVHVTTGTGSDLALIQGRAEAVMNEAAVIAAALNTGSDPDPGNATCNNRACHNPSNTAYTATWTVANAVGCAFCHSATNPNTGSHSAHMNAATIFGINTVACLSCHGTAPTVNTHRNGNVTFAAGMNYTVGAVDVGGTVGNCTTTTCHNDGKATPTATVTPNWGVPAANCTICHANAPATGVHAKHVANTTFVAGSCNDCHTAANTSTHINGSRNTANKVTSYTTANGTCANACHLVADGRDWTSGTKLACTDCHGSGKVTTPSLDRNWPPLSGAHLKHTSNASYVATNCVDCHNNNTVTHSTLNNVTTAALGNKISVNPANGSCTNSCHLSATANDWTGGAAIFVCTDCHNGTYVGGGVKGPSSGLHTGARITANGHDDSFSDGNAGTATCISCHTTSPSSAHINGVLNASAPTVAIVATVGFVDDAVLAPTCAPTGAMASCHDDGGVWKRKWSTSAKNSDGSECANCHGNFTLGFVTGMSLRHQTATAGDADGEISTSHDGCFMCHGYKPGELYYDFATKHRNGAIEVNNQVGFVDNGATVGCTGCHAANNVQTIDEHHGFEDTLTGSGGLSRWGRNLFAGPTGSCNDCHVSNGVGHGHANESVAEHNSHDQSGYTAACTDCHINNGPGPATHNNGTVNFGGTYLSNSLDYPRASGFGGNCAGDANGCHNSSAGNWVTRTLSGGCAACHAAKNSSSANKLLYQGGYPPTSAKHTEHLANNAYVPNDCTSCHGANAATGTHATHKNAIKDTIVNYHPGDNSCDNNCHQTAAGDWLPAGTLDCADCHNAPGLTLNQGAWPPVSNAHPSHVGSGAFAAYGDTANHSTVAAYEFGCGACHGNTASAHIDGSKTVTGTGWTGTACNNTYCHSGLNASNVRTYATTPAWTGNFAGDRCAACHGNSPLSGAHVEHQIGFHSTAIYTGLKDFLPVRDTDPLPAGLVLGTNGRDQLRGHGGLLDSDGTPTSTTISCYICHNDTVSSKFNDQSPICGACHNGTAAPFMGNATIADKSKHINNAVDVQFVDEKIRSKAQVRDNLLNVPELGINWARVNLYKKNDGSSYDEQPQTLRAMGVLHGGWNSVDKSCQISCHLWENGRVDKYPALWNGGAIICIDCHTRLPK